MNIQQFLESERVQFSGSTFYTTTQVADWLKDHDTRLINKVLDEVKREVEKKKVFMDLAELMCDIIYPDDILTIIDQLKLK